jgi:patatin-like phospholipase/acyl hydrolase
MPGSYLRLLSLDGDADGLRGLSSLMILEQLMEAVNPEMPPKPCDYFDMIGGTSTGGLVFMTAAYEERANLLVYWPLCSVG